MLTTITPTCQVVHEIANGVRRLLHDDAAYGFSQPAWAQPGGGAPEAWHWEA